MSDNERRRFHRIVMHKRVLLNCPAGAQIANLLDISLKGALVAVNDDWKPEVGNLAQARINLGEDSDDFLINLEVKVAHVDGEHVGLEIVSMDLDSATTLRRLVELNLADPELLERELAQLSAA